MMIAAFAGRVHGQDGRKVPISFLPPPLENATYSLGIYEAKTGKLVRRLREIAPESAFTVGLNGLMTSWDGTDDTGKAVLPGRYAARGYACAKLKIEGVAVLGNDWTADDENLRIKRVEAITMLPNGVGIAILAEMATGPSEVACYDGDKYELRWHKPLSVDLSGSPPSDHPVYSIAAGGDVVFATEGHSRGHFRVDNGSQDSSSVFVRDDPPDQSPGKDKTIWKVEGGGLVQYSPQGEKLRELTPTPGEPVPVAVAAAQYSDRLYLLEEIPGWQRVRGLSWVETKAESGSQVSTWQTFFERNIRPNDQRIGSEKFVEINLAENPLDPGKPQKIKLDADFDSKGSYVITTDGLRLRQVSQRKHLIAARVVRGKTINSLAFFQNDGAAWDEFSIEGMKNMMEFDAGEIEMTADGEKVHPKKAAEPDDL